MDNHTNEKTEPAGIPNVADKRLSTSDSKTAYFLFVIVAVIGFVGLLTYQLKKGGAEETQPPADQLTVMTSSRQLSRIPRSELEVPKTEEKPVPEEKPANPVAPAAEPLAPLPPVAVPTQLVTSEESREPTLAERRYAAPLMSEEPDTSVPPSADIPTGEDGLERRDGGKLGALLSAVDTPAARASRMPNRSLLLPKGTFIDCILETRLDTTVPGMTSCVVPRGVWSADGKVLLVERGSKVIGEYKGSVENGLNRIFVLWTQLQTPKGVRIHLDSPGTDEMGGAGLNGHVDFHWWRRFGNALLFSLIQDGFDFAISRQNDANGGVNYYSNTEDGMSEIIREAMRQSGNIPPTLTKNQGERIGIFVGRDLDFSSVYRLGLK